MYAVDNLQKQIFIGRRGEVDTRSMSIDVSSWLEISDDFTIAILAIRPGEDQVYIPNGVTLSHNVLTWVPDLIDTEIPGTGAFLVRGTDTGGNVIKSAISTYVVEEAFDDDGYEPTPVEESWLSHAEQTLADLIEDLNEAAAERGFPTGGTTGQVLKKKSNTDFDTEWANESGGGVTDVQVNGTSVVSSGVANIPTAGSNVYGVVKMGDDLTIVETVSGTTPSITGAANHRYVCGEVSTLSISTPASGIIDVIFESGSTPTVLTVTPPTGMTMKWANGFDPTSLEADTVYEINIMDGVYGVVASWT